METNECIFTRNPDNSPRQIYGVIHDLTDQKRMETALRENEKALQRLIKHLHAGIVVHAADTHITLTNKQASKLIGLTIDQMMGKMAIDPAWHFINEDGTPMPVDKYPVARIFASKVPIHNLVFGIIRPRTNDRVWVLVNAFPELDPNGQICQVVVTFIDITKLKDAEFALAAEKKKLDESMQKTQRLESLGVLAGGIAHDFNNLLGGMFGYVDMAKDDLDNGKPEMARKALVKAFDVFDRTKALTGQLLTFAKGGAPIRKIVDITHILENSTRFSLSGSNVDSHCEINKDLWLCDCDENQIGQVIDNMVINAQQSMPLGGRILVYAKNIPLTETSTGEEQHAGNYIKISIQDQGIGIPEKLLPNIFDPFFTTKAIGHGLGLATVYLIVNRHGGWIDVESELGKGTTFYIFLPAARAAMTIDQNIKLHKHTGSGTVLVMDDEEMMRETAGGMLENMGYDVALAKDGQEAIALFTEAYDGKNDFVFTILDLTIPNGMSGKDTVKVIRTIDKNAIVIVASGYADDPVMMNPAKYGFMAKLAKPFRKTEVEELLELHLKKPE